MCQRRPTDRTRPGRTGDGRGFSLGGLLAAYLGQREQVHRIVAISPFLGISFLPNPLAAANRAMGAAAAKPFLLVGSVLRERQLPEHGYPRFSSHAVAHGLTLAHDLMERRSATTPQRADERVLVINPRDSAVNNGDRRLGAQLASSQSPRP